MTTYYSEYSKVYVSVDCIIFGFDEGHLRVLIGKRQMDPGRGEWSLYGGFVGANESIDDAASRTLFELTGLRNLYMRQVGAFGNIDRDPGERVISVAYYALINVKDYGAVGDGITNDTTAWNQFVSAEGGVKYVPRGAYVVNGSTKQFPNGRIVGYVPEPDFITHQQIDAMFANGWTYSSIPLPEYL